MRIRLQHHILTRDNLRGFAYRPLFSIYLLYIYYHCIILLPIIERIQIPFQTKKIGHRRGWIVLMQIIILLSLIIWSVINPTQNLALFFQQTACVTYQT